ncbi:hypothetical protein Tco_0876347 [Tanacetum coccineum]|uniref:Uncharacterized protein n=1 Tax=Tanacetum coccineum TaxID=301880 RepID=A0ABQ5BUU3_9ASTR
MSSSKRKFHWGIMRSTGIKRYIDPIFGCKIWRTNRKCRIPIDLYPCKVEERLTLKKVGDQMIRVIQRRRIDKEGNVSRFQEYHTSDEEEEELSEHPPYNKYGFVDHPQLQRKDQRNKFAPYPLPPQEGNMNGTDILEITRKQLKTGKHGHENQKSTKRSQRFKAEARNVKPSVKMVKSWSTKVNKTQKHSIFTLQVSQKPLTSYWALKTLMGLKNPKILYPDPSP